MDFKRFDFPRPAKNNYHPCQSALKVFSHQTNRTGHNNLFFFACTVILLPFGADFPHRRQWWTWQHCIFAKFPHSFFWWSPGSSWRTQPASGTCATHKNKVQPFHLAGKHPESLVPNAPSFQTSLWGWVVLTKNSEATQQEMGQPRFRIVQLMLAQTRNCPKDQSYNNINSIFIHRLKLGSWGTLKSIFLCLRKHRLWSFVEHIR